MKPDERGFTILEALIAFAILSVVLVSLYASAGLSLHAIDRGAQTRLVALLARSKLDEIAATRDLLPAQAEGGFDGTDVTWQIETQTESEAFAGLAKTRLQDVALTLTWSDDRGRRILSLRTRHLGEVR